MDPFWRGRGGALHVIVKLEDRLARNAKAHSGKEVRGKDVLHICFADFAASYPIVLQRKNILFMRGENIFKRRAESSMNHNGTMYHSRVRIHLSLRVF